MAFAILAGVIAAIAGAIASVAGFGIGSLLTPLFALQVGNSIAVAAVSIAHLCGTALRFAILRNHLNKKVFLSFGLTSAVGGLIGALLHNSLYNTTLTLMFGLLLLFAGVTGLTGLTKRVRLSNSLALFAGGLSGLFGGLVGNQGGIRSAALLNFGLRPEELVATATGVALMVDIARVPVYIVAQGSELWALLPLIGVATLGVLLGTIAGGWILKKIPEHIFTPIVSLVLIGIGTVVLAHL